MEKDTNSVYLALAQNSLEGCLIVELRETRSTIRKKYCSRKLSAKSTKNFCPRSCCKRHIKHDKQESGMFKEDFRCTEMICLCRKSYCCFDKSTDKINFSSTSLKKRTLEETGAGHLEKYRRVHDEKTNVQSTKRGFRTYQHSVCTYEQTKRGLSYLYTKRMILDDESHTESLLL